MPKTPKIAMGRRVPPIAGALACVAVALALLLAPARVRGAFDALRGGWRGGAAQEPIRFAAAARDGAYYAFGEALAQGMAAAGRGSLVPLETEGSLDNLRRLAAGDADMALVQAGLHGEFPGVAGVAALGDQFVHVIVPADAAVASLRELGGKRVAVGPDGSGSKPLAEAVFGFYRLADAPLLVTEALGSLREAFGDGRIDAAFLTYALFAPAVEELLATGYYRLLPIAEAPALARYLPGVEAAALPPSLYGPQREIPSPLDGALPTLAVRTLLVARAGLPGDAVRAVLDGVFDPVFRQTVRLDRLDEAAARGVAQYPLHPAAAAFYRRNDPLTSDMFEIGSFFLAGAVFLSGAVQYLLLERQRRIRARQRGRMQPYFKAMLEYGHSIEQADAPYTLEKIMHDMMASQRDAEKQWLSGELGTEHMENLYAVYAIRSQNAYHKLVQLQLQRIAGDAPPPMPWSRAGAAPQDEPAWRPDEPAAAWTAPERPAWDDRDTPAWAERDTGSAFSAPEAPAWDDRSYKPEWRREDPSAASLIEAYAGGEALVGTVRKRAARPEPEDVAASGDAAPVPEPGDIAPPPPDEPAPAAEPSDAPAEYAAPRGRAARRRARHAAEGEAAPAAAAEALAEGGNPEADADQMPLF